MQSIKSVMAPIAAISLATALIAGCAQWRGGTDSPATATSSTSRDNEQSRMATARGSTDGASATSQSAATGNNAPAAISDGTGTNRTAAQTSVDTATANTAAPMVMERTPRADRN